MGSKMATVTVKIDGLDRLKKRLTKMQTSSRITQAVNDSTAVVLANVKSITPVQTGNLRDHSHAVPARSDGEDVTGGVENNCEYAPYVEFGTGVKGQSSYKPPMGKSLAFGSQGGQRAQSFMYRGLNNSKSQVRKIFQDRLSGVTKG